MCVPLVVFLSFFVLRSVSAGGVYCAKTARARAAALGLDYPGVHGAPDLYGPAHNRMHSGTIPYGPHYELAEIEPNVASIHKQAHLRNPEFLLSHDNPIQRAYSTGRLLGPPRGQSVINHESDFEEVNHVAPLTMAAAPGRPDLMNWDPQSRNKLLWFVYNEYDLVGDESVPNRRGVPLSGLPRPQSRGRGTHQRGLTGLGRKVPVGGRAAVAGLKQIRFPVHLPQPLRRRLNVRKFVQGNPVLRRMTKPKSGPVRASQ